MDVVPLNGPYEVPMHNTCFGMQCQTNGECQNITVEWHCSQLIDSRGSLVCLSNGSIFYVFIINFYFIPRCSACSFFSVFLYIFPAKLYSLRCFRVFIYDSWVIFLTTISFVSLVFHVTIIIIIIFISSCCPFCFLFFFHLYEHGHISTWYAFHYYKVSNGHYRLFCGYNCGRS